MKYTVTVMIIAQTLLILPIITGLTMSAAGERTEKIQRLARTLGAGRLQTLRLSVFELRFGIITALVSGLSRAISEVGGGWFVGGNIEGSGGGDYPPGAFIHCEYGAL